MADPKNASVRVLGIDPGSQRTGFGILDAVGPRLTYVASGVIRTDRGEFAERLCEIFRCVRSIVAEYRPQADGMKSLVSEITTMTKRSSHIPVLMMSDMMNRAATFRRTFSNHSNCGVKILQRISA